MADDGRADRADRAAEVPRGVPARCGVPDARGADGRHLPAHLARAAAAQRRHRRGRGRAAAVRRLGRSRPALRPHGRVPPDRARRVVGCAVRLRRHPLPRRGGHRAGGAGPRSGDLLRRVVGRGAAGGGRARRRLPHLGRAARAGGGEDRAGAGAGRGAGARRALRRPPAHDQPRHLRRGVGGGAEAARRAGPGSGAAVAGGAAGERVRGAAADARPARRRPRPGRARPGGPPRPVGGRGTGARWCGHGPGRQSRRGGRPDRGVPRAGDRGVRAVGLPAPGGGVLVRRGRPAGAGPSRPAGRAGGAGPPGGVRELRRVVRLRGDGPWRHPGRRCRCAPRGPRRSPSRCR